MLHFRQTKSGQQLLLAFGSGLLQFLDSATCDFMFQQHAVMVRFDYGQTDLARLFELEDQLTAAIEASGVGLFDGDEIVTDGSDGTLFMYGPDADKLFEAVRPILTSTTIIRNLVATLRYGPPNEGARERKISFAT
jgi:hypothetical protein